MPRKKREDVPPGATPAEVVGRMLPTDEAAARERERLLNPMPPAGYRGDKTKPGAPLSATEMRQALDAPAAMAMDRPDATERLEGIRRWLLDDPTFERDLWTSIREKWFRFGYRHCLSALLRVVYGWRDNETVQVQLGGATVEQARDALNTVTEAGMLDEHDVAENGLAFFRWYRGRHPERWTAILDRMNRDHD